MSKPKVLMMDEPSLGPVPDLRRDEFSISSGKSTQLESPYYWLSKTPRQPSAWPILDMSWKTGAISFSGSGQELLADDRVRRAYLGED